VKLPRATSVAAVALPLAMLAWALLPVILGSETFFLRDLFAAQLGLREELAQGLAAGRMPLVDAHRLGQPLAGNPNAAAFYPTAALHAVAPLYWSFSAHLWIHLFVAPFALAWLGRELGLGRRAAWAAGVSFAFCGYTASQLAFLNLIAGVTLAPALAAAAVGALARARRGRRRAAGACAAAAGALWGLILLGGDPMTAALAAGLAVAAAAPEMLARAMGGEDGAVTTRSRLAALTPGLALLALGLTAGTLLALPQIVEFLRILPASARAQRGFSEGVRLAGSLDPRQAIEWLVPFAFGRPDLLAGGSYWGHAFYQGSWAFLYTLYPGLGAIALVAAAGLPWRALATRPGLRRPALLGAALAAGGGFLALGAFNPLAAWLLTLPLLDVLRFPSKTWLLAAVGLSLLAGVGFERAVVGGEPAARRRALAALLAVSALLAGLWVALRTMPRAAARRFLAAMPDGAPEWMAAGEVARWSGLALLSLAVAAAFGVLFLLAARRPRLAGALLVALHAGTQLFLLAPAMATDATLPYTLPSRLLEVLPADEVIVHGAAQDLFGEGSLRDGTFPEPRAAWIFRRGWHELFPMAGGLWDRRYDLVTSPEALDPLPTRQAHSAVENSPDDRTRLRLLAAWGTERLILDRPLADADRAGLAEPVASAPSFRERVWVYRMVDPAPPVHLAERVIAVETSRAAARRLGGEDFRRGEEAVVVTRGPGAPPAGAELPGLVDPAAGPASPVGEGEAPPGSSGGAAEALPAARAEPPAASGDGAARNANAEDPTDGGYAEDRAERGSPDAASSPPRVHVLTETAESLVADVDSPAGGLLVWRQAWLPIYRATVDGVPAVPIAANIHHLAVPVPPGHHRVILATDRRPLTYSLLAAALGLLTLLLLATRPRRRSTPSPPPAP
jgi:hypothetical protein